MVSVGSQPRFLHAADLHLGAPIRSFGGAVPAHVAENLRSLARRAYDRVVDTAIREQVAFVVLAGDVYDDADKEAAAQARIHAGLERLYEAGIPVFIAHGNHDPVVTNYRPLRPLPPNVTVFQPGSVQAHRVPLETVGGGFVTVAGTSHVSTNEVGNLAQLFFSLPALSYGPVVGVLHANVGASPDHLNVSPCTFEDLSLAPVHYFALGHVHTRSVHQSVNGRWWAYPGNIQGRSTDPMECGAKGVLVVPLGVAGHGDDVIGEPRFVACDTVRFERIDVDVSQVRNIDGALAMLSERVTYAAYESEGRPLVLHARFVGATAVHEQLWRRRGDLLQMCRSEIGADDGDGGVLGEGVLVRVDVATTTNIDRFRLKERGDIVAEVLGDLDRWRLGSGDDTSLQHLLTLAASGMAGAARHPTELMRLLGVSDESEETIRHLLLDHIEAILLNSLVSNEGVES